jgi:molybdopterin/thiamine biosynthesis adenylyltransferase
MNESRTTPNERDIRQRDLVPSARLAGADAIVIGAGAIGRQVALQLAALGAPRLTLFDDDLVQTENLAPQGYWPEDLNRQKVSATAELCRRIHPSIKVSAMGERFKRSTPRTLNTGGDVAMFCCVDSISTRRMIWESVRSTAHLFVDGRMNAEMLRVLAVDEAANSVHYERTLFAETETFTGACTARSTIYAASVAAGFMVLQFTKWLRRVPVDPDLLINLFAAELSYAAS